MPVRLSIVWVCLWSARACYNQCCNTNSKLSGNLEVKSSPSHAKIYINGVDAGEVTKWIFDDMAPGEYDVFVTLDGYTTPETEHVIIVSGQTVNLHFMLKKDGTPIPEFPSSYLSAMAIIGFLGAVLSSGNQRKLTFFNILIESPANWNIILDHQSPSTLSESFIPTTLQAIIPFLFHTKKGQ